MDNIIVKTTNKEEAISSIMDVVEVYAALSFQIDGDDIVRLNYEDKIICSFSVILP